MVGRLEERDLVVQYCCCSLHAKYLSWGQCLGSPRHTTHFWTAYGLVVVGPKASLVAEKPTSTRFINSAHDFALPFSVEVTIRCVPWFFTKIALTKAYPSRSSQSKVEPRASLVSSKSRCAKSLLTAQKESLDWNATQALDILNPLGTFTPSTVSSSPESFVWTTSQSSSEGEVSLLCLIAEMHVFNCIHGQS